MNEEVLESAQSDREYWTLSNLLKFIVPSLLGVSLFLIPVEFQGIMTVVLGMMSELLKSAIGSSMAYLTTFVFVSSALLSLFYYFAPAAWDERTPQLSSLFKTNAIWLSLRVLGGIFSVMTLLGKTPV